MSGRSKTALHIILIFICILNEFVVVRVCGLSGLIRRSGASGGFRLFGPRLPRSSLLLPTIFCELRCERAHPEGRWRGAAETDEQQTTQTTRKETLRQNRIFFSTWSRRRVVVGWHRIAAVSFR